MDKILFVANGGIYWASSRYRSWWVAEEMGADCVNGGKVKDIGSEYDTYIFNKQVDAGAIKALKKLHKRIIWDICDPVHWFGPEETKDILMYVDHIVTSNPGLTDDFAAWSGRKDVTTIPDTISLAHYNRQKEHGPSKPVRFIWYGAAQNRGALYSAWANLERLKANGFNIELTIFDNIPEGGKLNWRPSIPIYNIAWELNMEVDVLLAHDIALLPPYPGPWGEVKSNNKTLTAWACGLPVVTGLDYWRMVALVGSASHRAEEGQHRHDEVLNHWTINRAVEAWQCLLS